MTDLFVEPQQKPLFGIVPVPSDKSITHRALIFAALASGESALTISHMGDDNRSTLAALRALGVGIAESDGGVVVTGVGLHGLTPSASPIDCGNSGTTMRLFPGFLAAQRFATTLVGDASLTRRPMSRIANPLRLRGARIEGTIDPRKVGEITPPLTVGPLPEPNVLSAISYESPIASAQVKSALLVSGLYADGRTTVGEPFVSRDHTERMLGSMGVPISRVGAVVELDGPSFSGVLHPLHGAVPGDLSAAAFLVAAATITPGSEVSVRGIGTNPTRSGFVDAMRMMGAHIELVTEGDALGEPVGLVRAGHSATSGITLASELVARSIDEIPILAAVAACARGTTTIVDASELRVKESDRIAATVRTLRAFGVEAEERRDGMVIRGRAGEPLEAADVSCDGDHRIAMSAAVLGLVAKGPTRVRDVDAIATSFPRFAGTLRALGASVRAA